MRGFVLKLMWVFWILLFYIIGNIVNLINKWFRVRLECKKIEIIEGCKINFVKIMLYEMNCVGVCLF